MMRDDEGKKGKENGEDTDNGDERERMEVMMTTKRKSETVMNLFLWVALGALDSMSSVCVCANMIWWLLVSSYLLEAAQIYENVK